MPKRSYPLEPLDRVVNLYLRFREDGNPVDEAWQWACLIARTLERESFREDVEADIAAMEVLRNV